MFLWKKFWQPQLLVFYRKNNSFFTVPFSITFWLEYKVHRFTQILLLMLFSRGPKVKFDHTWKHFWNVSFQRPHKVFLMISYTRELYGSSGDIWEWNWAAWTAWATLSNYFVSNLSVTSRESLVQREFGTFWHEILPVSSGTHGGTLCALVGSCPHTDLSKK